LSYFLYFSWIVIILKIKKGAEESCDLESIQEAFCNKLIISQLIEATLDETFLK